MSRSFLVLLCIFVGFFTLDTMAQESLTVSITATTVEDARSQTVDLVILDDKAEIIHSALVATGSGGVATFYGLPAGGVEWIVRTEVSNYEVTNQVFSEFTSSINVILVPAQAFSVNIVDQSGGQLANAELFAVTVGQVSVEAFATTDAFGRAQFSHLSSTVSGFYIRKAGKRFTYVALPCGPTVTLSAGFSLSIVAEDVDDATASISISTRLVRRTSSTDVIDSSTLEDFELANQTTPVYENLRPGTYIVDIEAPGFAIAGQELEISGQNSSVTFMAAASSSLPYVFSVEDGTGNAISEARVLVVDPITNWAGENGTNSDDEVVIVDPTPLPSFVFVSAPGYEPKQLSGVSATGNPVVVVLTPEPSPALTQVTFTIGAVDDHYLVVSSASRTYSAGSEGQPIDGGTSILWLKAGDYVVYAVSGTKCSTSTFTVASAPLVHNMVVAEGAFVQLDVVNGSTFEPLFGAVVDQTLSGYPIPIFLKMMKDGETPMIGPLPPATSFVSYLHHQDETSQYQSFETGAPGTTVNVEFSDLSTATANVTLAFASGTVAAGIEVRISTSDQTYIGTTGASGVVSFANIKSGLYHVETSFAVSSYVVWWRAGDDILVPAGEMSTFSNTVSSASAAAASGQYECSCYWAKSRSQSPLKVSVCACTSGAFGSIGSNGVLCKGDLKGTIPSNFGVFGVGYGRFSGNIKSVGVETIGIELASVCTNCVPKIKGVGHVTIDVSTSWANWSGLLGSGRAVSKGLVSLTGDLSDKVAAAALSSGKGSTITVAGSGLSVTFEPRGPNEAPDSDEGLAFDAKDIPGSSATINAVLNKARIKIIGHANTGSNGGKLTAKGFLLLTGRCDGNCKHPGGCPSVVWQSN